MWHSFSTDFIFRGERRTRSFRHRAARWHCAHNPQHTDAASKPHNRISSIFLWLTDPTLLPPSCPCTTCTFSHSVGGLCYELWPIRSYCALSVFHVLSCFFHVWKGDCFLILKKVGFFCMIQNLFQFEAFHSDACIKSRSVNHIPNKHLIKNPPVSSGSSQTQLQPCCGHGQWGLLPVLHLLKGSGCALNATAERNWMNLGNFNRVSDASKWRRLALSLQRHDKGKSCSTSVKISPSRYKYTHFQQYMMIQHSLKQMQPQRRDGSRYSNMEPSDKRLIRLRWEQLDVFLFKRHIL